MNINPMIMASLKAMQNQIGSQKAKNGVVVNPMSLMKQKAANGVKIINPPVKSARRPDEPPPYESDLSEFELVNGKFIPKNDVAFRQKIGLGAKESYRPIQSWNISDNKIVKTEPLPIGENKYGISPPIQFTPLNQKIGVDKKAEWNEAYQGTKKAENLPNAFGSNYVTRGYNLKINPYKTEAGESKIDTEKVQSKILSPLSQRVFDYKNSEAFVERLAGANYNKEIDINKWVSDPSYRSMYAKKYLQENPIVSKKIIEHLQDVSPATNVSVQGQGSSHDIHNVIKINPIFHARNYANKQEHYDALLKEAKNNFNSYDKNLFKTPENLAKSWQQMSLEDTNTPEVLSHEAGHHFYNKENLVKNRNLPIDQVYPENKMIWELNKNTAAGKKDYEKFKDLLGSAQYKGDVSGDDRELTHEESPEETKADVYSLRDYLYNKYNFDSNKEPFNEKMLNTLLQDKEWSSSLIGKRLLQRIGTDKNSWLKLMNLMAARKPSTQTAIQTAKNGVVIKSPAKKYTATINGKTRSFGAKGYTISPGTPKGDNYCARSSGIKKCQDPPCANDLSRKAWGCVGKKSVASKAVKYTRK